MYQYFLLVTLTQVYIATVWLQEVLWSPTLKLLPSLTYSAFICYWTNSQLYWIIYSTILNKFINSFEYCVTKLSSFNQRRWWLTCSCFPLGTYCSHMCCCWRHSCYKPVQTQLVSADAGITSHTDLLPRHFPYAPDSSPYAAGEL